MNTVSSIITATGTSWAASFSKVTCSTVRYSSARVPFSPECHDGTIDTFAAKQSIDSRPNQLDRFKTEPIGPFHDGIVDRFTPERSVPICRLYLERIIQPLWNRTDHFTAGPPTSYIPLMVKTNSSIHRAHGSVIKRSTVTP